MQYSSCPYISTFNAGGGDNNGPEKNYKKTNLTETYPVPMFNPFHSNFFKLYPKLKIW